MQAPGTVTVYVLCALSHALVRAGASVPAMIAGLGLPPDVLDTPEARVPIPLAGRAFEEAAVSTGDPHIALRAAEALPLGAGGFLDCHVRTSSTWGEALRRTSRYFALLNDQATLELDASRDAARLTQRASGPPLPRMLAEFQLAVIVARARALTAHAFPLDFVGFTHPAPQAGSASPRPAPQAVGDHARFFGCEVRFDQPVDEIVFARSLLDLALPTADPRLASVLERYGQAIVARLPARRSFLDDVRRCIAELLRDGDPSLDATAARLDMSRRTLQRKLRALDTSHNDLVDAVRRELALRLLAGSDSNITEVAYLLGFSEPAAFHRAFKRWTGRTPAEHRRAGGTLPPPAGEPGPRSSVRPPRPE